MVFPLLNQILSVSLLLSVSASSINWQSPFVPDEICNWPDGLVVPIPILLLTNKLPVAVKSPFITLSPAASVEIFGLLTRIM